MIKGKIKKLSANINPNFIHFNSSFEQKRTSKRKKDIN